MWSRSHCLALPLNYLNEPQNLYLYLCLTYMKLRTGTNAPNEIFKCEKPVQSLNYAYLSKWSHNQVIAMSEK